MAVGGQGQTTGTLPMKRASVPSVMDAGWTSQPIWVCVKNLAPLKCEPWAIQTVGVAILTTLSRPWRTMQSSALFHDKVFSDLLWYTKTFTHSHVSVGNIVFRWQVITEQLHHGNQANISCIHDDFYVCYLMTVGCRSTFLFKEKQAKVQIWSHVFCFNSIAIQHCKWLLCTYNKTV